MTRGELIEKISAGCEQLSIRDVELAVKVIVETLAEQLTKGNRVEIRGFGSFSPVLHAERIGRNPKTGEQVMIGAKRTIHFKPGLELKDKVIDKIGVRITDAPKPWTRGDIFE